MLNQDANTSKREQRGGGGGGLGHTLIWCKWAGVCAFGEGMVVFKVLSLIPPFSIVDNLLKSVEG